VSYNYRSHKIAAVLSVELDPATALRVLGHLGIALGAHATDEILGRHSLSDAQGGSHRGIARYPVIILRAKPAQFTAALDLAKQRPLLLVDFPRQMLETGPDDELARTLAQSSNIEYLGFIIYGKATDVNAVTNKFSLWRTKTPGFAPP
jgi:uncharacterized protein DUF2000